MADRPRQLWGRLARQDVCSRTQRLWAVQAGAFRLLGLGCSQGCRAVWLLITALTCGSGLSVPVRAKRAPSAQALSGCGFSGRAYAVKLRSGPGGAPLPSPRTAWVQQLTGAKAG